MRCVVEDVSDRLPGPIEAVVVDASAAVAFLGGEDGWADQWAAWSGRNALLLAPSHFRAEVANALVRSVRLAGADAQNRMSRLASAGVDTADRGLPGLLESIELAERHNLTVYDAAYLQLALEVDAKLATLDLSLSKAAVREGIEIVPPFA